MQNEFTSGHRQLMLDCLGIDDRDAQPSQVATNVTIVQRMFAQGRSFLNVLEMHDAIKKTGANVQVVNFEGSMTLSCIGSMIVCCIAAAGRTHKDLVSSQPDALAVTCTVIGFARMASSTSLSWCYASQDMTAAVICYDLHCYLCMHAEVCGQALLLHDGQSAAACDSVVLCFRCHFY